MTDVQQRKAAAKFAKEWQGRGYEKGESQPFWLALLRNVFGVEQPENYITFEDTVKLDHTSFIDGFISATHVLIEQKGLGKDLLAKIKQSDGSFLTPFQQAKRYVTELPLSKHPRWIVTCNFGEFLIYDMEKPQGEPEQILLENLEKEYYRLNFLVDTASENIKKETAISLEAGRITGELYKEILEQYQSPDDPETLRCLNMLCVRLVFCLYAEDSGIFGSRSQFHDYLKSVADKDMNGVRAALIKLFKMLNTEEKARDPYEDEALLAFPYVNGGLFDDENIIIPRFNERIVNLLLKNASEDFDWSGISPTIFGAVFESTLNPVTRRSGGMHYTSIENIHKVIDPLFLDSLRAEFDEIKAKKQTNVRIKALQEFQEKLSGLVFFDPACGSGNFLTETYISIRRLENQVLRLLYNDGQITIDTGVIKVSIGQFYGIEINDFAVTVARTALWIAESQMMKETEDIVNMDLNFLPLKSYANIVECNALTTNWESVVPKDKLDFIMGNPPFVGYSNQNSEQKADILSVYIDKNGKPFKTAGKIDYVAAWYYKAAEYLSGTAIRAAFVSTNSITQGEQVAAVWKPLFELFGVHIDFAYRTFKWDNETPKGKAAVHCVIVGFSTERNSEKIIYDGKEKISAENINPYLVDAPNIFIESRSKPICDVPQMITGNRPADGGHLIINNEDLAKFIKADPLSEKYIKQLIGAIDFINNKKRWCLWLVGVTASELRKMPEVMKRITDCKQDRENSTDEGRRKLAETPSLFRENLSPRTFLLIPRHSTENRRYIPIGFLNKDYIPHDSALIIPEATFYHFGILTSNVHMAWVKVICGRIKSDYRYSKDIVYNNFPWIDVSDKQKSEIERLAHGVLDARALFPDCSLADLYDPLTMPKELLKAHKALDRAVMKLYGFSGFSESEIVAGLMERYKKMVEELNKHKPAKKSQVPK